MSEPTKPDAAYDAAHWGQRATAAAREGRYDEVEAILREGVKALPGQRVLLYALGIQLLARGDFELGWVLYENRRIMPNGPRAPAFSFPEWDGKAVGSLLVLPEQGFGDQILFARWIPELTARGVSVTLVTPPDLAGLFAPLGAEILRVQGEVAIPRRDAWCFAGSLPRLTGATPTAPYLPSAPGGAGVGLMLRGNPEREPGRVFPEAAVARLSGLGRSLHPDDTGARDFAETAAIIAGLDLVISVDTSVANLAAAMGKPTWVILPRDPDWRWGREPRGPILYPTARTFRQPAEGDWDSVTEAVLAALAERPGPV